MLTHIKKIISDAEKNNYALGAFNVFNLETAIAVTNAANNLKSPVILQITQSTIDYAGLDDIANIIKTLAEDKNIKVPLALHLDHGKNLDIIKKCIDLGFSSIHIDGSELSYEENIKITKRGTDYAHSKGVWTQGELGKIRGKKDLNQSNIKKINAFFTDPKQAKEFVQKTGINTFAPSVGAMHGMFKGKEKINQNLLTQIKKNVNLPLVLHGASGVSTKDIKLAIKHGIRIINIDTSLRKTFTEKLKNTLSKNKKEIDPRKLLQPSIKAVSKKVEKKIKLFGSNNRY